MGVTTFNVDFMQMKVYYIEAAGETAALTTVLGTSAVGTVDKTNVVDTTGISGTSAAGTLDLDLFLDLGGVVGTSAVDTLTAVLVGDSEQEGFRWRDDDGTEVTATWRQLQDVDDTIPKETNIRLRILVDSTGNLSSQQATLQYRRDDEAASEWRDV